MKPLSPDTSPEAERILIEGYRRMSPAQKLDRVCEINELVQQLALARIRRRYPQATPKESRLRLASLWIEPELMRRAFGWDPEQERY